MKRPGIHLRLLVAAFLLICASAFTLDVVGVHITRQFMVTRFRDRISFLAKYLALNSEVGVLIGDRSGLKSLALNLLGEEDVARVTILDNHDRQLVDLSRAITGPLSVVEAPVRFKKTRDEDLLFRSNQTPFGERQVPGVDYIGKVRITFSTHGIDELMVEITRQFILFSTGLAIIAGLVFYFISRSIVLEVTRLATTARQVGKGELTLRARPGSLPETRELAVAFNSMLDSLEWSSKALENAYQEMIQQNTLAEVGKFSTMIAHEVKNPLSIIKSSLDVLKKDNTMACDNTMVFYMEDEIRRLDRLIEEFLTFARPIRPAFRDVDINALLRDTLTRLEFQKADFPIKIRSIVPPAPCHAHVDPDLLARVFGNILRNAFDANGDRGVVTVTASSSDSAWSVRIEDEGEGIDPENLHKVFEPFFTTRSKGTGLGLAYAYQVILSHNGIITAENRDKGGAVFKVEIPVEGKGKG